ncbi:uncharacterized protein LOC141907814 [Tubulanus polymorphus]|uniref:uncharacterized protein LOC141907814 n=1 Tax=Tubulanus polymorphus TaxID=672921 RepID=UPI003DA65F3C
MGNDRNKLCCYGLCNNDGRYPDRPAMQGVFFINFPKPKTQLDKCKRWIQCCGRPHDQFNVTKISKNTFICSKHFVGGEGPTSDHPDPIPATATTDQIKTVGAQTDPVSCRPCVERNEIGVQTIYSKYELQSKISTIVMKNNLNISQPSNLFVEDNQPSLSLQKLKEDDKKMKYFTGLTYLQFEALFNFLGPSVNNLRYWNRSYKCDKSPMTSMRRTKPMDELFITLVRLRRGFYFHTMSFLFKLSEFSLRSIFTTWLQFLYCHFNDMRSVMFPDRTVLRRFLPKSFKGFKNVRCSVDCTEFFCEMPRDFTRQGNLYSNYKHHHTFKCLIAVAPNGTAVFVSKLFEGAVSDREIFEKSQDKWD